jgi:spore coat protein CotH
MRRRFVFLWVLLAVAITVGAWLVAPAGHPYRKSDAATTNQDLFTGASVVRIQIEIPPAGMNALRKTDFDNGRPRPSVKATVIEGSAVMTNVELHLKGWFGSFRPVDDTPCFTLRFDRSIPGQTFHGLRKISLNNSVQDRSFLSEKICRELFEAAGVPTARAGHAKVELNGRDLGLYVLTEGFDKQFLKRYFKHPEGNLYESHSNHDINESLIVNGGSYPGDNSGLKALAAAVDEPNPTERFKRLEKVLDMDRFLSFVAMEVITCHWDGYTMNQNNFRIFHDLGSHKMVFIPAGMDQMFGVGQGNPDYPILPPLQGVVSRAVLSTAEGKRRYLERLAQLYQSVFKVESILRRVDVLAAEIQPVIGETSRIAALRHRLEVDRMKSRIAQRNESLSRQLSGQ